MRSLWFVALFACNGSSDPNDSGDSEDTTPPNVLPVEGAWTMSAYEFTTNECNVPEDGEQTGGTGTVVITGDDSFSIEAEIPDQGSVTFECTVNVQAFSCEAQTIFSEQVTDYALITINGSESGQVASETELNGILTLVADCEGDDCEFLATAGNLTFPCDTVLTFSATAAE